MTEPVPVDNSGSIARLEVKPQSFKLPFYTFQDTAVKYVAFDFDGNVAICEINITVTGTLRNCVLHCFTTLTNILTYNTPSCIRRDTAAVELSSELRYRIGEQTRELRGEL